MAVLAAEEDSRSAYIKTQENKHLHGYVVKKIDSTDEMSCSQACLRHSWCTSSNFKESSGNCELNKHEFSTTDDDTRLTDNPGTTFSMFLKGCLMAGCFNGGSCLFDEGKDAFACSCSPQWRGEKCEMDINECETGKHHCDSNAFCNNTKGSYICTCKPGYTGNGVNCTDINECETGKHHCHSNAFCNNTKCYTGNGVNCTGPCRELAFPSFLFFADKRLMNHTITTLKVRDLDECELRCYYEDNCVSLNFENKMVGNGNNSCELNNSTHKEHDKDFVEAPNFLYRGTNNPCGSSPCKNNGTCQSGFTKKGYRCLCQGWMGERCQVDIDECDEKSHECSKSAYCTNKKGSYRCKCKTGFHGDGYKCTDIDECQEKRCGKNATCTNTEGSFRCTCNIGYYGDGYKCTECYTVFDFEDHDLSNWTLNGTAFNNQPTYGNNTLARGFESGSNYKGDWWIGTYENRSSPSEPFGGQQGDGPQGSMTSPSFQITGKLLTFLIGSGCDKSFPNIRAELIIGGEVVRNKTTKACDEAMKEESWNVTDYAGKNAQLRLIDYSSGIWGHINFDNLQACHKCISDTDP